MGLVYRQLKALFDGLSDALVVIAPDGRIRYANDSCEGLLGYPPSELVGRQVEELIPARFPGHAELRARYAAHPTGRRMGSGLDLKARHRDGREIAVDVSLSPVEIDGEVLVAASLRDLGERAENLVTLRVQATALASAANGIMITDREGIVLWANPAAARLTGYSLEELVGEHTRRLKSGVHDEVFYRELWSTVLRGKVWSGEIVNRRKDGSLYHEEQTIAPVVDEQGEITHLIAIKQDVTDRRHTEEALARANAELADRLAEIEALNLRLREQALRDSLTGLHNRRFFDETLPRELQRSSREGFPLSLVALDLDNLKGINDRFGHGTGDEALRALASFLLANTRRTDLVCRLGGDELAILLPGARLPNAVRQAEICRVGFSLAAIPSESGGPLRATFSAGVAELLGAESADHLIGRADAALYEAKRTGRNRVVAAPRP